MPTIDLGEINWLAVIVSGLVAFFIGGLWYSALFGNAWTKAQGWSAERIAEIKATVSPPKFFGGMIVACQVLAFAMALIATKLETTNAMGGASLAAAIWLAVAAVLFTVHLASNKALAAFLIDAGCALVYMLIMGAIIGAWR